MNQSEYTIEVTNLAPQATEKDVYDFFSFCGVIDHVEIIRSGEYAATGYVTFKEEYALETAVLLSGATICDQRICIVRMGQHEDTYDLWARAASYNATENHEYTSHQNQFVSTPSEALTFAQDVVKTMLAKGYNLSKDALVKAKALDESYKVSATAGAKVSDLSQRIGLTDKLYAGIDTVRSVDQRFHVSDTTKTAISMTGRAAAAAANSVVNSSYFSAGAHWLSGALARAAQATENLASHGSKK